MRSARRLLPWLLMLSLPTGAVAQIYVCKDASGRTITADRPMPECANRPMRELDRNGMTRREIAPPPTPQQRKDQEAIEEKKRAEAAVADEQRLYDRALTTRYRNEADIAVSRQRVIDLLNDQMRIDTNALARETKELKTVQAIKPGTSLAERRRLDEATRAVDRRQAAIAQRNEELARTHQKYDLALQRFREIQGTAGSAPAQASASASASTPASATMPAPAAASGSGPTPATPRGR